MSGQLLSNYLFAVVGPTATGKTALALRLATALTAGGRVSGVTIISADSRQVFQGLEVCSGVDLPPEWSVTTASGWPHFHHPSLPITLTGVAMIAPDQEWSVTTFRDFARPVIAAAWAAGQAVLVVGGTGLYHQQLFSLDPELAVPPDHDLRQQLAQQPLTELQAAVAAHATAHWQAMNHADRHNPRRLVRVLEKSQWHQSLQSDSVRSALSELPLSTAHFRGIGLLDTPERLLPRIESRVAQRLAQGAINEVTSLLNHYPVADWRRPAFSTTGCREIRLYLEEQLDQSQLVALWSRRELQYAKRQLTWWKGHRQITAPEAWSSHHVQWLNLAEFVAADAVSAADSATVPLWQTAVIESCILGT